MRNESAALEACVKMRYCFSKADATSRDRPLSGS